MNQRRQIHVPQQTLRWVCAFGTTVLLNQLGVIQVDLRHMCLTVPVAVLLLAAVLATRHLKFVVFSVKGNRQRLHGMPGPLRQHVLRRREGLWERTAIALSVGGIALPLGNANAHVGLTSDARRCRTVLLGEHGEPPLAVFVGPLVAVGFASVVGAAHRPAVEFVGGALSSVLGLGLLHFGDFQNIGARTFSVGEDVAFDAVLLSGFAACWVG